MDKIDSLRGELSSVVEQNWSAVILDFEGKEFVPWGAFETVLVSLHTKLNDKLRMCNLPVTVAEHFETNLLAMLFHIYR